MLKKTILAFSMMAMFSLNSFAESTTNTDKYKVIAKNIMSSYNIGDAKKISNDFNTNLSDNFSENKIKTFIRSLQSDYGQIKSLGEPVALGNNAYSFLTEFEKGKVNLILVFDNQDKVSGIQFKPVDSNVMVNKNVDKYKVIAKNIMSSFNTSDAKKISNDFSPSLADKLSENKIKDVMSGLQAQFGQIKSLGEPIDLGNNTYAFPADFDKGQLNLILGFDNADKIAGILFQPAEPEGIKYPDVNKNTPISEIIKPYMDEKTNVGLVVGIIDASGKEQKFSFGRAAKDKDKQVNENTIFEIGSISKVFTSTVLADMYLNKEVDLKDNISKYLPSGKAPSLNNKGITLEDLAEHISGLPRLPMDLESTVKNQLDPYAEYTKDNLYSYVSNYKLTREPEKSYEYSNLGSGLLGEILADKEKTSYEDLINKHITDKLGMKDTGINFNRTQIMNFSSGHDQGEIVPMWNFKTMQGAGALKSDLNDMMKFLSANMGLMKNNPLQKAMDLAHQPRFNDGELDVGLGWHITSLDTGDKVTWHNGGTGGYTSFIGFIKDKKVGVVILSNSTNPVDDPAMLILKKLSYK